MKTYSFTSGEPSGTPLSVTFTYDNDQLTSFNGKSISYNSAGQVSSYGGETYRWSKGKLSGISSGNLSTGSHSYSYSYNAYGQRISSDYMYFDGTSGLTQIFTGQVTSSSKQFTYDHLGRLVYEITNETQHAVGNVCRSFKYLYDENEIIGIEYTIGNTTGSYIYQKNIFGDVIGILTMTRQVKKYFYRPLRRSVFCIEHAKKCIMLL